MRKTIIIAAAFMLGVTGAQAQTPRKGGTIRCTAPYGSSFSKLDIHTTNRAPRTRSTRKAIHRSLYNWDSTANKPVLELAKAVTVSDDGLVHTFKLRDDAFFHHGRKMTADDVIWTFTRLMDGAKAYPGARYVRIIKGAVEVEKGQAKAISGLKKIDDFTLEMTLTEKVDPGFYFFTGDHLDLSGRRGREGIVLHEADRARAVQVRRARAGLAPRRRALGEVLQARQALCRQGRRSPSWARRRRATSPSATRRSTPRSSGRRSTSPTRPIPNSRRALLEVAEVFTRHMGMNPNFKPFADKRVRQAINHAIDTDLIIKRLVKGKAYRATSWLPLSSPAYDKDLKPYAYDPGEGEEAPRRGRLSRRASSSNGPHRQNESWGLPIVEAVIPMLEKVGIKVKIKPVEATVLAEVVRKGDYQAYIWSATLGPRPAGGAEVLPLRDAAIGLQLHHVQEPGLRQAPR